MIAGALVIQLEDVSAWTVPAANGNNGQKVAVGEPVVYKGYSIKEQNAYSTKGQVTYARFVPKKTAIYTFTVKGTFRNSKESINLTALFGQKKDFNGDALNSGDGGYDTIDLMKPRLEAGKTYYLAFYPKTYYSEDEWKQNGPADITISVKKHKPRTSGTCGSSSSGKELTWEVDENDVLTISGKGKMESGYESPWYQEYYYGGQRIKKVVIKDGVTRVGDFAFSDIKSIKSVTLADSVTSIGEFAFHNCSIRTVKFPKSLNKIGDNAFSGNSFRSLTIPGKVKTYGEFCFANNKYLTKVVVSKGCTKLGATMFCDCKKLTKVKLPSTLKTIGSGAFSGTALKAVKLPKSVTAVRTGAFYDCRSLKSITVHKNTTKIGSKAFGYYFVDSKGKEYRVNGCVIKAYKNSAAAKYAKKNRLKYRKITSY